ncbi:ABC transporter-like [Arabidopsis thaliana x Arabidopsis arenosa]|uniref:ABC transporter-like n=1 Tax=Arabidopsis thaliana x Arabidopsis arenosa TaxID=1240361 RepID=A0A8T1XJL0_9BRAS|nr:ABC transporter-like [Arabidopsis thaliana x Arabidopsis arenosa]
MAEKAKKKKKGEGGTQRIAFYKLFTFADRYDIALMVIGTLSAMANGLTQPFMAILMGQLINVFGFSDHDHVFKEVFKVAVKFLYLAAYAGVMSFLQVSCWMVTGERQSTRIRRLYLKTILRQDIGFFDTETNTGEVIGRMSGDTILIQDSMGEKVGKFTQLVSSFVGGFTVAFIVGRKLTLALLPCIPLLVGTGGAMTYIMSKKAQRVQLAYTEAGNVVQQAVGSIRTVVAFTGEKQAMEKYEKKLEIAYRSMVKQGLYSGLGIGIMLVVVYCTYGFAIWYGARLIMEKGYTGGQVINVIMSILTGGMALGQTLPSLNSFAAGTAAAYKMFETIKRRPKIDAYDMSGKVLEEIKGDIELRDVYFRYPARPDVQIFAGFSLTVTNGMIMALVGQSGSGKSTVISLIERFYDPESGVVLIDGIDLKKFQVKWIRSKIGLVSQEPILFATTIRENIVYGKKDATDQEIRNALQLANASKFIDKLPQGLETMVGEHGTQLSGGQKQRIAIARAILKNPKILLLDEATSALDAESERIVQDALVKLMLSRTTVVVAHRLTTIRTADMIAVVQQGKIIEKGTHDEMIKDPEGTYSQLVRLQEGSKKEEAEPEKCEMSSEIERSDSQNGIHRRNSSSSRHSLTLTSPFGLPGVISLDQREEFHESIPSTENQMAKKSKKVSLKRLAHLNKPEISVLLVGSLAAVIHGIVLPVQGLLLSHTIRIFFEPFNQLKNDSHFWALIFLSLGLTNLIVIPFQNYFFAIAGGKLIKRIRSLSFDKVLHQDISWFDDTTNSSGAIGARLSTDASIVKSIVGDAVGLIMQNMATIVAAFIIAFTANWLLALMALLVAPVMFFQAYYQIKFITGFGAKAKGKYEEASQVANDAVSSIRTVASFCAEDKVMDLYQEKCDVPKQQGFKLGLVSGLCYGGSFLALYLIESLCFVGGSWLIQTRRATFGEFFQVFFALTLTAIGVTQSSAMAPDISKAKDSAASIFDILDTKPKIDSSSEKGTVLPIVHGDIELQHVSFRYPMRPDIQIFSDLCLTISSGQTVALVGESGSGKSTVISLLERFYDPDSGKILLDQVEIQSLKLSWLREQMGLVSQEPVLFNETIRSNIVYGKTRGATEEEIITAAKAANVHNFISSLPQGYETSVGERGVQLSGGQKQRIAIARAILKDPKILLLDEATSALDAESERVVQDALDRVMVNRTTVVVAHRLTTIKGADVIAVVKNGVIAESGRHETLMEISGGAYASLVAFHMNAN